LQYADLSDANLYSAKLQEADLTESILKKSDLRRSDLSKAILENADLTGADLSYANLNGAFFGDAVLDGVKFEPDFLTLPENIANAKGLDKLQYKHKKRPLEELRDALKMPVIINRQKKSRKL
jgi:uncharacterized protein YjbI with pentapeptide repeats